MEAAVDDAEARLGRVDILCNNAGISQGRLADGQAIDIAEMPETLWRLVLETNATGCFLS